MKDLIVRLLKQHENAVHFRSRMVLIPTKDLGEILRLVRELQKG